MFEKEPMQYRSPFDGLPREVLTEMEGYLIEFAREEERGPPVGESAGSVPR